MDSAIRTRGAAQSTVAVPSPLPPPHHPVSVPDQSDENTQPGTDADAAASTAEQPLGNVLSLHTTPTSSDHVSAAGSSRPDSVQTAPLTATSSKAKGGDITPPLDAAALYSPAAMSMATQAATKEDAAPHDDGAGAPLHAEEAIHLAATGDAATTTMNTAAAAAENELNSGSGSGGAGVESSVATPCFSAGKRSPHYSPSAHPLPLRPKPRRFAALDDGSGDSAPPTAAEVDVGEDASSSSGAEPFAATLVKRDNGDDNKTSEDDHDGLISEGAEENEENSHSSGRGSRQQRPPHHTEQHADPADTAGVRTPRNEEDALNETARQPRQQQPQQHQEEPLRRKRPISPSADSGEDDEEASAEVHNTLPWGNFNAPAAAAAGGPDAPAAGHRNNSSGCGGGAAQMNSDVARALAAFSSSIHGATAPRTKSALKPSLSPHHSYVPWRLSDNTGRGDGEGGQVSLPSFDADHASSGHAYQTRSPPPPKPRARTTTAAAEGPEGCVESNPIGSAARVSGGPISGNPAISLTSPRSELSTGASLVSEPAAMSSGSYAGSGCLDAEASATAAAAAALNSSGVPPARFGGGGVLRHNPAAYLAFSGSGSGSQGGDGAIDRSTSSHFSAPSRGAASLSPPYLAVDEENGELAVVFRRDGLGREQRHHGGGSPNSPLTGSSFAAAAVAGVPLVSSGSSGSTNGGVRGGAQASPSHLELNNTLDETFGTMVSTMSTTFSTTTNSVGDADPSSPGDAHRLQVAAQMRQALLQTLGLNAANSSSTNNSATLAGLGCQGRQRSEKAPSVASATTSSVEATAASSGLALPLSPMRDSGTASTYSYIPRLPHLGQAAGSHANTVSGGNALHAIATPPASSRNPSSAAVNLASSASLSTNSATSPTATGIQSRSVAAMFAALTTPNAQLRHGPSSTGVGNIANANGVGTFHAKPSFFDIDSGAEDEEGEGQSGGKAELLRTSMSEEGSRMLSLSVSNPLVYEDLPSSEISSSQQFNAAVQPPPSLQLAYPFHRHSLTENFNEFVPPNRRTPVSGTPTCSATKMASNADDLFSNSTSSLLPPVLKSTARGGGEQAAALEEAAAEAVLEVNNDNAEAAMGEAEKGSGSYSAGVHPPPLVLSPVAHARSSRESESSNPLASTNSVLSSLHIESAAAHAEAANKRRASNDTAPPLGWPSASSHRTSSSSVSKPSAAADTEAESMNDKAEPPAPAAAAAAGGNAKSEVDEALPPQEHPAALVAAVVASPVSNDRLSPTAPALASPVSATGGEVSEAIPVAGLEWSSHSLSMSARTRHYRGEDGVNSPEDDDTSGTATTRAPNSTSQYLIQPVGSLNFSETPELLLDAGPINSHSRRDFVNTSAVLSSASGNFAAAAAAAQQTSASSFHQHAPHSHVDPSAQTGALGIHGTMASRPGSATTTTTTNGDLSASTSTRMWTDGIAATTTSTTTAAAAAFFRRYADEAVTGDAESPVMPQPLHRHGPFASVPLPHFPSVAISGSKNNNNNNGHDGGSGPGNVPRRSVDASPQLDVEDGDDTNASSSGRAALNPSGTSSLTPSSPPQSQVQQQQQLPVPLMGFRSTRAAIPADVFGEDVKEPATGSASQLVQEDDDEDDMWGEPTTSMQSQQPPPSNTVADDGDDFAEPAVAPVATPAQRHVDFADPSATQFAEPPSSPWTDRDFFYEPDYTRMEFKHANDNTDEEDGEKDSEDDGVDAEEAAILRAVPHFRFTHRCANAHGSPAPRSFVKPNAPSWAAWTRGADTRTAKANKAVEDGGNKAAQDEASAQQDGTEGEASAAPQKESNNGDGDGCGERAPRVFFTKERLAARAALMEARRAALQRANSPAKAETEPSGAGQGGGLLSLPTAAVVAAGTSTAASPEQPAAASPGTGLRIRLAPPTSTSAPSPSPPAAAPAKSTIAVALPDFAAPVTASSSPAAAAPSRSTGLFGRPPPSAEDQPPAAAACTENATTADQSNINGNARLAGDDDDDDGFGGWVQPAAPAAEPAPFALTREWCLQVAAELKRHGTSPPYEAAAAAIPVDSNHVVEVLRTVFGEDSITASDAACAAAANSHADTDEASEALGVTTSTAATAGAVSSEVRGVDGVLEALSFTSLTQRNSANSAAASTAATPVAASASVSSHNFNHNNQNSSHHGAGNGAATPAASTAPGGGGGGGSSSGNGGGYPAVTAVLEDGGYVVPWRTRTSAATNGTAASAAGNSTAATAGADGEASVNGDNSSAALTEDSSVERASLRLTRHLLFPGRRDSNGAAAAPPAAALPVSAYMGTRRLPDAPTAAQWTERDVLLAVQQEQRRMAQENEGAVETERLEDVLRLSS